VVWLSDLGLIARTCSEPCFSSAEGSRTIGSGLRLRMVGSGSDDEVQEDSCRPTSA
jgi:hypothetical protein